MKQRSAEYIVDGMLGSREYDKLASYLQTMTVEEIGHCINVLQRGKKKIFRLLPLEFQQEVVREVNDYSLKRILSVLTNKELKAFLEGMPSDEASDIVSRLPYTKRTRLLRMLKKRESQQIEDILQYPDNTAGHLMQKELLKVPESSTIADAIRRIRRIGDDIIDIQFVFITDTKGKLKGYIPLEDLIIKHSNIKMKNILQPITSVPDMMDQEEVTHVFKQEDLPVLPVVDEDGKLVGRITSDDVVDVLEEEQSEDMYQMAGIVHDEHVFDPAISSAGKRLVWLLINLMTAVLAATVVALFEGTIQRLAILAAYMPIVAGMGGNAGTQVITIMVRSIALKEVEFRDAFKVLTKELTIALFNGIILGTLIAILSYLYSYRMNLDYDQSIMLGVVVGSAMVINLIVAGVMGTLIPLCLRVLRLDPALASSVFLTTCTDITGFFVFLGLATILI